MNGGTNLDELLKKLKEDLKVIRNPDTDLSRAIEILERSTESFKDIIEKLEVESITDEQLQNTGEN